MLVNYIYQVHRPPPLECEGYRPLGHPFPKRRGLGRAAQGCAGGAPAVMRLARYLRAGRVLTSALGGPFHSEPENLDPPLGYILVSLGSLRS